MVFTAVLHLHSRYAYACSKDLILTNMVLWAMTKGIELLSTADFTHLAGLSELEGNLVSTEDDGLVCDGVRFFLGSEISCVYKQGLRSRRVHLLVYAPTFKVVHQIRQVLEKQPKLDVLRKVARQSGNRNLQQEGIVLVAQGITSVQELSRVLKQ